MENSKFFPQTKDNKSVMSHADNGCFTAPDLHCTQTQKNSKTESQA